MRERRLGAPTVNQRWRVRALRVGVGALAAAAVVASGLTGSPAEAAAVTYTSISTGGAFTCAITAQSAVDCWGDNTYGELGVDTAAVDATTFPVRVTGLTGVTALATGGEAACAIKSDTTVVCWGANGSGQLGDGTNTSRFTPQPVPGLSGVTAIGMGWAFVCALLTTQTVKCWGFNGGRLGNNSEDNTKSPVDVSGLTGAVSLGVGDGHSCAVKTDTTVMCWGRNTSGELGDGTTSKRLAPVGVVGLTGVAKVAAGAAHSCALKNDTNSTVVCWGAGASGQIGNGVKSASLTPAAVSNLTGVTALSSFGYATCAVTSTKAGYCWGGNGYGVLGDGTETDQAAPVQIGDVPDVAFVSTGDSTTCILTTAGLAWCWGYNSDGELGDCTTDDRIDPAPVYMTGCEAGLTGFSPPAGTVGVAYSYTFAASGPGPFTYLKLTGSWPAGLSFNATTGVLSGTPTTAGTSSVTLRVTNGFGSDDSDPITISVRDKPGTPTSVTGVAGYRSVAVSWKAPTSNGGASITEYVVTSTPGSFTCSTNGSGRSCTVPGLLDGTSYTFKVTARNSIGVSAASAASAAVKTFAVPAAPTGVTGEAGYKEVTVSWTTPASNGGTPITGYIVTASTGQTCTPTGTTRTCTVTGLKVLTSYTFTVKALNRVGESAASAKSPSVKTLDLSGPVRDLVVVGVAADGSVNLSWTPPANSGGAPVLSYRVRYQLAGSNSDVFEFYKDVKATTVSVKGLPSGRYYFSVRANTLAGSGAFAVTPTGAKVP